MAPRRLIAILLVLLFLSSLAAALAPVPERTGSESTPSTTDEAGPATLPDPDVAGSPRVVTRSIDASADDLDPIRARVGDRIDLRVTSQRPGTIELVGIGPTEDVGPRQPAFFDVIVRDPGTYPIEFLASGEEITRIVVTTNRPPAPPR